MRTADVVIRNPSGLHARPGAVFVKEAGRWASAVRVENVTRGKGPVDAKSMLGILTLGAATGHTLRLSVDGLDEETALVELVQAVEAGLGEQIAAG